MNEYEESTTAYNEIVAECGAATQELDEQVEILMAQIADVQDGFARKIATAKGDAERAAGFLKAKTVTAWRGDAFPAGKKRLPLDRGAWVQISERTKREVVDSSAAARFIVSEGIEDTAIKKLLLDNDVVDAVMIVKRKFPGVHVSRVASVSTSLPKTKAKKEEGDAT